MSIKIKVPEQLTRAAQVEITGDGEEKQFSMSISSDEPYKRYDWWNDKEYWEVLDHGKGGMDDARLKAGLPILFNHDRNQHLGRATNYINDGKKVTLSGIKWSESEFAQTKKKDAESGALPDTSVGYRLLDEGVCIGERDGLPIYKFRFEPFEGSLVTVPADISVGVGRNAEELAHLRSLPSREIAIQLQKGIDGDGKTVQTPTTGNNAQNQKNMKLSELPKRLHEAADDNKGSQIDIVAERQKWEKEAADKRKQFDDFCDTIAEKRGLDYRPLAKEYLDGEKRGKSFDDFRQEVFMETFKAKPVNTNGDIGASEKEVKRFSVLKALRDMASGGKLEGLEREMCAAAQKELKRDLTKAGAFILPAEVTRYHQLEQFMQRAQSAGVFTAGGATVAQEMQGLIEYLRNDTVLGRLGITILSGLVGDLVFPVQTGGSTAYWVSETGALTDSEATFGNKTMTPHRLGATIPVTTQILAQSSISMENWVRRELDIVTGIKADAAGLQGTGVAGEPLGVANTTGINATVTFGGAPTWADCVEFETGIATDNAAIGPMKFALSTSTVGKWKTVLRDSVAGAAYLIQDNGMINGYSYERTNQITGNIAFFGVWAQLLRGIWAGREIIVDPYALKKSGQIEVTVNEMTDFLCRQPASFNVSTDSAAQ